MIFCHYMPDWIVPTPERLDVFLTAEGRLPSRAKAQAAIEAGLVTVNGEAVRKPAQRLQEGDRVALLADVPRSPAQFEPADLHLNILYEDAACMVLEKPAGIAVHPGSGMPASEKTMLHGIAYIFGKKKIMFAGDGVLVHRLDRETTGCLLVAKTPDAHRSLQEQFQARTIDKQYLALVAGVPKPPSAVIDAPIGRATFERTKMSIMAVNKAREAKTTYRTLASSKNASLLLCDLHTGRTHQLRVHLHAIGHPILGDPTYVSTLSERLAGEQDIGILCLHAWKLSFESPADRKRKDIIAPLPEAFARVLKKVGVPIPQ